MRAGLPLVVGDVARYARAVWTRLFRWLPRVGGEAWAVAGGWDDATVPPRPAGYCTVITAECTRGSLRGRGAHLSVAVKSTAFNETDSGPQRRIRPAWWIKAEKGESIGLTWPFCSRLPCLLHLPCILSLEPRANGGRR